MMNFSNKISQLEKELNLIESSFSIVEEKNTFPEFQEIQLTISTLKDVLSGPVVHREFLENRNSQLENLISSLKKESRLTLQEIQGSFSFHKNKSNYVFREVIGNWKDLSQKGNLFKTFNLFYRKNRDLFLRTWEVVGERVVNNWKKILNRQNNELKSILCGVTRSLKEGSAMRDLLSESNGIEIPISSDSGFRVGGNSIVRVVLHEDGEATVETTASVEKGPVNQIIPKNLLRILKPTLIKAASIYPDSVYEYLINESIKIEEMEEERYEDDDTWRDKEYESRTRLTGYNPVVTENYRLKFDNKRNHKK